MGEKTLMDPVQSGHDVNAHLAIDLDKRCCFTFVTGVLFLECVDAARKAQFALHFTRDSLSYTYLTASALVLAVFVEVSL